MTCTYHICKVSKWKNTCPKINTHVSCVRQEIDILSFCVTANTKDACPECRANKGIYFPIIAMDILNRQQAGETGGILHRSCQSWAPHTECQYTGVCSPRKIRFFGVSYSSKMFVFKSCTNRKTLKSFLTSDWRFQGSYLLLRQISEIIVEWVQQNNWILILFYVLWGITVSLNYL